MKPIKAYFQPINYRDIMIWIWWLIVAFLLLTVQFEIGKFNWFVPSFFIVELMLFVWMIFRRELIVNGSNIFFKRALHKGYLIFKKENVKRVEFGKFVTKIIEKNGETNLFILGKNGKRIVQNTFE